MSSTSIALAGGTGVGSRPIRELTDEEIALVSGAFSYAELYASAFAGAAAGAVGGLAVGGVAGIGAGALAGAVTGSVGYLAYEGWMYCFG